MLCSNATAVSSKTDVSTSSCDSYSLLFILFAWSSGCEIRNTHKECEKQNAFAMFPENANKIRSSGYVAIRTPSKLIVL